MQDVKETMIKQIGLELQAKKEGVLQETIEKRLGHDVRLEDVLGRMTQYTNAHNYERFLLDGVELVTFSPLKTLVDTTDMANATIIYRIHDC